MCVRKLRLHFAAMTLTIALQGSNIARASPIQSSLTFDIKLGASEPVCRAAASAYNYLLRKDKERSRPQLTDFEVSQPAEFAKFGFHEPPSFSGHPFSRGDEFEQATAQELYLKSADKPNLVVILDSYRGEDPYSTLVILKNGVNSAAEVENALKAMFERQHDDLTMRVLDFTNAPRAKPDDLVRSSYLLKEWPNFERIMRARSKVYRSLQTAIEQRVSDLTFYYTQLERLGTPAIQGLPTVRVLTYNTEFYLFVDEYFMPPGGSLTKSLVVLAKIDAEANLYDKCYLVASPTITSGMGK